jgi:hypothetical protein
LLVAFDIDATGQIAGFGVEASTGDIHGFLATPCNANSAGCADVAGTAAGSGTTHRQRPMLSESAREQLQQRLRFGLPLARR